MIRDTHIQALTELVEQAERDAAGYRRMLQLAQQELRVGMVLPDPLTPAGPVPAAGQWGAQGEVPSVWNTPAPDRAAGVEPRPWVVDDQPVTANGNHAQGREPYTTGPAPVFDGTLPPGQEAKLGTLARMHDAYAATDKAREEEQEWRQA